MKLHLSKEINTNLPKNILSEVLKLVKQEANNKIFHYFRITHKNEKIYSIEHTVPILKWSYQLNFNKDKSNCSCSSIDIVIIVDIKDIYIVSLKEFNIIKK
ncbi:prolipoprotein diacylglyceryl transferase and tran [Streptococcus sanguinis SK1057]|uniref:hypothetical protein n=1 Tax=Streptococcus sanguinis TaxID=1305 RepID=UPI000204FAC3|nr:hypothetical protein [Streptococcus sanguinis]EGF07442.1 prolipoprotein diacylglyceryl transferase and tran [Streptococcus sanguinis SK1057]